VGAPLALTRLSASAYEDLRRCPYRYFALRLLKLQEAEELDAGPGKREFGNWLHSLLSLFHEALLATPTANLQERIVLIDTAADQAAHKLGLTADEFLPFAAAWPRVRDGYLDWLRGHEAKGYRFARAELPCEQPLGKLTLIGRIDRLDQDADGGTMVLDYKTEHFNTTRERTREPQEDTQLAFYAALLHDDTLRAAYVNLGEKDGTRMLEQPDVTALRDQLLDGIQDDMQRIAGGAALPALGEGKVCDFCAARGMCRKDFWEAAP
jgi:ATP-dependent helicase/nuclease subunit B